MGESHENLLKAVRHYQESLDKYTENRNDGKLLHYLEKLYKLPIKVIHLEETGVGRTVNGLRKLGGDVGDSAKSLVAKWKEMVVGEQEDDDEEEDDDEDEEEDGYQTGEEPSNDSDDKDERDDVKNESSSHRKSDSYRNDDREKYKKGKHSSKSENPDTHSSKNKDKDAHKHHKHNGHVSSSSKYKSHKRKVEDTSSDEETPKKRQKKESSEEDEGRKQKKCREEEKKKHHEDSSKSNKTKEKHKESNTKDKYKTGKKEEGKKHDHSHKTKEKDKKGEYSKSKDTDKDSHKNKEKNKSSKSKGDLSVNNNGIDSGSGASFAEALGMCEPSSSRKKKSNPPSSDKKEKPTAKVEDPVPKLLKEPHLEPIDLNLSSLLPTITPNYRPLGSLICSESQPKKFMSDYEALSSIITSKNQRTKVYSGNKVGYGKVPSLFDLCIRILQDNIDALEYTGGVPYNVLKPILEKSNPNQLYALEHHNPYLIEETDELWQLHCQKEFRNKRREEFESWREMYLRCLDERDAKLKALTANIKQSQDKSLPVRTTKLAYVDAVAKPPRNIARKQAKNGTAFERKPSVSPAAKLSALATSGDAGKIAVPNPGARAAERSNNHPVKPKKAPLMLKSISSFKNRFKR